MVKLIGIPGSYNPWTGTSGIPTGDGTLLDPHSFTPLVSVPPAMSSGPSMAGHPQLLFQHYLDEQKKKQQEEEERWEMEEPRFLPWDHDERLKRDIEENIDVSGYGPILKAWKYLGYLKDVKLTIGGAVQPPVVQPDTSLLAIAQQQQQQQQLSTSLLAYAQQQQQYLTSIAGALKNMGLGHGPLKKPFLQKKVI